MRPGVEQALHAVIGSLEFILSAVGSYLGALRRAVMEPDFTFRKVGPAALGQMNEQGAIRVSQRAVKCFCSGLGWATVLVPGYVSTQQMKIPALRRQILGGGERQ